MAINRLLLNAFLLISIALIASAGGDNECVYTVYVRTGSIIKGGTDSNISMELWTEKGDGIRISNVETWGGLMGSGWDYFERGNLDIFSGRGPCVSGPICAMNLISDGTGKGHGWYCNYVEVTTTGPHVKCAQQTFQVEQWLATDTYPYELTALRNYCSATPEPKSLTHVMVSDPTLAATKSVSSS